MSDGRRLVLAIGSAQLICWGTAYYVIGVLAAPIGAGYGLVTIARGTLPLVLFATGTYGATVGLLLAPGFALSALSPLGYAFAIDWFGARAALLIALALALLVVAAAVLLNVRERSPMVARSFDRT